MSGYADRTLSGMRWSTGGLWYQFITSGPEIETYEGGAFAMYKGSAVAVKLPKILADGSVVWDNVTPMATGSTLEVLPNGTPVGEDTTLIQRVHGVVQVQLISEPSYRFYANIDQPKNYKTYKQLIHSWASIQGCIYNAGCFMLSPDFNMTDKAYDAPPTTFNSKQLKIHEPDMDWPHDAAIIRVIHEEFGSRNFIVAVDASSRFYCWPYQLDGNEDLGSPYSSQGQKVTIPNERVQSLEAPFPSWVHVPVGDRRDTDWPIQINSGEPRYVWRFHPQGTKVVGLVLQRETFTGAVYGQTLTNPTYLKFTQVEIDDVQLKYGTSSTYPYGREGIYGDHSIKNDTPGYVEFSIDITLTGVEEDEFTFDLTLLREQQTDATHYPVAADYLSPVLNGWDAYGINGNPGDLVVLNLECYYTEREQTWIARHCGYIGISNDYIRQSFLKIINIENGETLVSLITKNQPEDFFLLKCQLDVESLDVYKAQLMSIDLGKLSWVYRATKTVFTNDLVNSLISETNYDVFQKFESTQTGVRCYVFGSLVYETEVGDNLNIWTSLDALSLVEDAILYNPLEIQTRWLDSVNNTRLNRWWLRSLFDYNITYRDTVFGETFFVDDVVSVTAWDAEIEVMSTKYSFFEKTVINDVSLRNEVIKSFSNLSSESGDISWTEQQFDYYGVEVPAEPFDTQILHLASVSEVTHTTNVFEKLTENCFSCSADYLNDVFIPWIGEILVKNELKGSVASNEVFYSPPWDACTVYSIETFNNPGYIYNAINIELSQNLSPWIVTDSSLEDFYLSTYLESNTNQRIYDYPVGKEIYMREWTRAVNSDSPLMMVCPEGFYAGVLMQIPYITNQIPYSILYARKNYNKELYSYGFYAQNALVLTNQPELTQFNFTTIDLIGHIDTEDTVTHQNLYETAYQHLLEINDPEVRINVENYQYIYEKKYIVNGITYWQPFFDTVNSHLYKPILNGSMLFSK